MILLAALLAVQGPKLDLTLLPSGAEARLGGYRPFGLKLSTEKPARLKEAPSMTSPRYGVLKVGTREFLFAMDGEEKVYVDTNQDGDLTNDPPVEWGMKTVKTYGGKETSYRQGFALVDLSVNGKVVPCRVGLYESGTQIGYFMDFALTGSATLGGANHQVLYVDESATWDGKAGLLVIDEKGDGKLGPNSMHPAGRPFLMGGKEYEFGSLKGAPAVLPSTKKIEPIVERDPNAGNGLHVGSVALPFSAATLSGQTITFPGSFKGKVVLLDFWATWCGPCMREVPNVVKAYQAYHAKGLEVLGVSLDQANAAQQVKDVTAKQGMTWDQVYDGNYFKAAIAQKYKIQAIPEAYLIDGDTGKVLAFGDGIRGEKLAPAIEKALAAKSAPR